MTVTRRRRRLSRREQWTRKLLDTLGIDTVPVIDYEQVTLNEDGSSSPVEKTTSKPFVFVNFISVSIEWSSNAPSYSSFGGVSALTNGLELFHGQRKLFTFNDNEDFLKLDPRAEIKPDETPTTKLNVLTARIDFDMSSYQGLGIPTFRKYMDLRWKINDDLSGVGDVDTVFHGWIWGTD